MMSDRAYVISLALVLMAGTLAAWSPGMWAVSLLQSGVLILAMFRAAEGLRTRRQYRRSWLLCPLAAMACWPPLQLITGNTIYRFPTWNATLMWCTSALFFWIALETLHSTRTRELFLSMLLSFGCSLAILSVLQHYMAPGMALWLFPMPAATFGPFVYKNQFAAFLELLIPIALYRMVSDARRKITYAVCTASMAAAVVASASRAGTVLGAAEIAVIMLAAYKRGNLRGRQPAILAVALGVLLTLFVAVAGWQPVWSHFHEENPVRTRALLLESTLNMIRDHPVIGVGLGNWRTAYPAYALFDNSLAVKEAHNDWAQWAAEGGVPFLLLMLIFTGGNIGAAWRSLWGIGIVAFLVHALVDYPSREPALQALWFALMGAAASAQSPNVNIAVPAATAMYCLPSSK